MPTFIKLTNIDESEIYVNVDQIQTITKDGEETAIQFEDGEIFVRETPERIIHSAQAWLMNTLPVVDRCLKGSFR